MAATWASKSRGLIGQGVAIDLAVTTAMLIVILSVSTEWMIDAAVSIAFWKPAGALDTLESNSRLTFIILPLQMSANNNRRACALQGLYLCKRRATGRSYSWGLRFAMRRATAR